MRSRRRHRRQRAGGAREVVDERELAERGPGAEGHDPLRALAGVADDLDLAVEDDEEALAGIALRRIRPHRGRRPSRRAAPRAARAAGARGRRRRGCAPRIVDAARMLRVTSPVEPARQIAPALRALYQSGRGPVMELVRTRRGRAAAAPRAVGSRRAAEHRRRARPCAVPRSARCGARSADGASANRGSELRARRSGHDQDATRTGGRAAGSRSGGRVAARASPPR